MVKEDEEVRQNFLYHECADKDFWGYVPFMIGVHAGMEFVGRAVLDTLESGAVPDEEIIKQNIENAHKVRIEFEKKLDEDGGEIA